VKEITKEDKGDMSSLNNRSRISWELATLPPFCPIEAIKLVFQISSQSESQKNWFALSSPYLPAFEISRSSRTAFVLLQLPIVQFQCLMTTATFLFGGGGGGARGV
jgi:hypothetical protein